MAGMSWVRVDASISSNAKILTVLSEKGGDHAFCVFIFGLGYCALHGTAGFIPQIALGLIHGRERDAALLVAAGLWHELPGGFDVNDYLEFQPSDEESQKRSEKAKKAAEARWQKATKPTLRAVK
jgi:hypothetical protein